VFENSVLRRIFGPKKGEVIGERRKLHNEELNDLYCLPNIIGVFKSRKMRWAGHAARSVVERRDADRVFVEKMRERGHLEDPDIDGRIILRWIFKKWCGGAWNELRCLRTGTGGRLL
jgi:hypothetical protein